MSDNFAEKIQALKAQSRYRALSPSAGIDFTSNDYLGMREHPALRRVAIEALENGIDLGAAGSRLLRGNTPFHSELEEFAAAHFGAQRALYFATGFQANYALFTTLPQRGDVIVFDEFVHASVRDGIAASHAKSVKVAHNDVGAFEAALKKIRAEGAAKNTRIWVAIESVYSMDGDDAPVADLHALAMTYDAMLIVDEAHSTGVLGDGGRGVVASLPQQNLIAVHTCGKAIGVAGGLICADAGVIEYMINAARPFIFSTAPPPLQALLVQRSLEILATDDGDARREKLRRNCEIVQQKLGGHGGYIVPIILGDDARAVEIAAMLQGRGFDVRAIRPPSVPAGMARLRLSLSSALEENVVVEFCAAMREAVQE